MTAPRIVFLSFAPQVGGVTTYQAYQLEHLASRARVTFIDERPDTTMSLLQPIVRQEIATRTLPLWSNAGASVTVLLEQWRQNPPDIIAVSNPGLLVRLVRALMGARHRGARIVHTVHSGVLTPTWRRRAMALGAAAVSLRVDEQVYVSAYTKELWESRFPWLRRVRSRIVHNGVCPLPDVVDPRALGARPRIGFVGRLHREKGIVRFLELAQLASASGREWEFHVFGDGPEMPAVRAAAATVRCHGHVSDVRSIFEKIDVLLVPSPIENCPYVVLEAKQAGVPSVAASVGGLPEIIAHGVDGLLVPTRNATDFLSALDGAVRSYPRLTTGCLQRRRAFEVERQVRVTWEPHMPEAWHSGAAMAALEQPLVGSDK